MSTRCQVKVTGTDINNAEPVTLYHHCDGYPEYMLPTIAKGWQDTWQAGRIGKAAAMICSADPTGFEIEQGHGLHGDIEYYYVVDATNGDWQISAYKAHWGCESVNDMRLIGVYNIAMALNYDDAAACTAL